MAKRLPLQAVAQELVTVDWPRVAGTGSTGAGFGVWAKAAAETTARAPAMIHALFIASSS